MPGRPLYNGYARDPKGKQLDLDFKSKLLPDLMGVYAGDVDLRPYATSTHQYGLPSCVGNATADSIEIVSAAQGFPKVELSRQFVWTLARTLMARRGEKEKTGTYIRLAFQVLHKFGICLETTWPYSSKWDRLPSLKAMREAAGRKIQGYYRISERGAERVEMTLKALRADHPVVFGTKIDKRWQDYDGSTILGPPTGEILGGHAMVVVGYISGKGFIVKNSWGDRWGDGGYCYLSASYLAWGGTEDLWVPTIGKDFGS